MAAGLAIALLSPGEHSQRFFGPGHHTLVQLAARYLGLPPAEIRRRMRAGESLGAIAAQTAGRSRAGLLEAAYRARTARIERRHLAPPLERAALRAARRMLTVQLDRPPSSTGVARIAARYLGVGEAKLARELAGGRTLATIADATPARSSRGLVEAIVLARHETIERALAAHTITAAEARRESSNVRARAERQISRSLP